jgi:putative transposase
MDASGYKTCERWDVPGHAHYLNFSCFKRRAFLVKDGSRKWVVESIGPARALHDFHLWAWVIMPEHVHLVICPRRKEYSVSEILRSIKKPVTNAALRHVRAHSPAFLGKMLDQQPNGKFSHRFWQRGGGYDTNLWTAKILWEKIEYIHNNPAERGLVKRPQDWEWSSAREYRKLRDPPLMKIDFETIPWLKS